tara:strand:+ start:2104 stop:2376 length:273 start_codon:yes stop_codon:yes gene_type:complete
MSITNDGAYTTITNSVVETDQSSWGFKSPTKANSNGCKCCEKCRNGTGDKPCEDCNYLSGRKDGTMGCDEKRCKCTSAVAYVSANPDEFA